MAQSLAAALRSNFLGNSPHWYKLTIVGFLILNPILAQLSPFVAGWALVLEFIFTLAMALRCYPLQPGGLLAVEAIIIGLATPEMVYHEAVVNFPVILLLMFMVAGIYFLREMLLYTFHEDPAGRALEDPAVADVLFRRRIPVRVPRCTDRDGGRHLCRNRFLRRLSQVRVRQEISITTTTRRRTTRSSSCTTRTWCSSAASCAT